MKELVFGLANLSVNYKGKTDSLYVLVRSYKDEQTIKRIQSDKNDITLFIGSKQNIAITAEFVDGHTLDITNNVLYKSSDPQVVTASKGTIEAKSNGETVVTISYTDEFGNVSSTPVRVKVTNRNPFIRNKADEFNEQSGVQIENSYDSDGGKIIAISKWRLYI